MAQRTNRKVQERGARVAAILPILKKTFPKAGCSLVHADPLQLLVATILSAQCTDVRVNIVTRELFKKYRSAADWAAVSQEQLESEVRSTGFYHNKAKAIRGMAASLVAKSGGKVPGTMEQLTALPGVGRKTANVVLGNAFGQNVGVVVDTHVGRVSRRLGLSSASDPVKVEQDLMAVVPQEDWTLWSHLLIDLGRSWCKARKPDCPTCPLRAHCPFAAAHAGD